MSYCVNCGVELDNSAKRCPLCDTPVYNPQMLNHEKEVTPFSQVPVIPSQVKTRFIALIVSVVMLIPSLVCLMLNLFFSPDNLLYVYTSSTIFLCWIVFVFPFIISKVKPYLLWAFDSVAIALYVFLFYFKNIYEENWYYSIALPSLAIISACVLYYIFWTRKRKHHWTSKMLHIFIDLVISLTVLIVCLMVNEHTDLGKTLLIADASILALLFFWLYANKSKRVRAWLAKRVFV